MKIRRRCIVVGLYASLKRFVCVRSIKARFAVCEKLYDQWISRLKCLESTKVAISTPQHSHAIFDTNCGNSRIVKLPAGKFGFARQVGQDMPMLRAAVHQVKLRRRQPRVDLRECLQMGAGRLEYSWIGDDGEEFMHATHGDSPWRVALC